MDSDDNKKYNRKTGKDTRVPVLSFKWTQESALSNSNILSAFNGNLGEATEAKKGIALDYGSELRKITGITKSFNHH